MFPNPRDPTQVGEWFRTRNAELQNALEDTKPTQPPTTPQKSSTEPLADDKDTIPSPSVLAEEEASKGNGAVSEGTPAAAATAAAIAEGDGSTAAAADGGGGGEKGGAVAVTREGGQDAAKGLGDMSQERLAKLKEEQEEHCKELAMNVNVFMPYKVKHVADDMQPHDTHPQRMEYTRRCPELAT